MKRSSRRRSRKRRKRRPKSKPPTTEQLAKELGAILAHAEEGELDAAERRKVSNLIRAMSRFKKALANGASITELRRLLRDPLSDDGEPDRSQPASGGAAAAGNNTEEHEVEA